MTLEQRIAYFGAIADDLLRRGDALNPSAESRRLLRECRRYRMKVRSLKSQLPR